MTVQSDPQPNYALASSWREARRPRRIGPPVLIGLLTGSFASWAYYGATYNYFAHTFGLWILATVLVAARRTVPRAITSTAGALTSAVLAFYLGLKIMYAIKYSGMPYPLNAAVIVQWVVISVIAAGVLGTLASQIGRADRWGTCATGAATGLLVADLYRRISNYPPPNLAIPVIFTLLAASVVFALGTRSRTQLLTALVVTPAFTVAGSLLVGAPDFLQQLLATGSITQAFRMLVLGHV